MRQNSLIRILHLILIHRIAPILLDFAAVFSRSSLTIAAGVLGPKKR
jgi:hypothetical protein